jgi:hypothetical protein
VAGDFCDVLSHAGIRKSFPADVRKRRVSCLQAAIVAALPEYHRIAEKTDHVLIISKITMPAVLLTIIKSGRMICISTQDFSWP